MLFVRKQSDHLLELELIWAVKMKFLCLYSQSSHKLGMNGLCSTPNHKGLMARIKSISPGNGTGAGGPASPVGADGASP